MTSSEVDTDGERLTARRLAWTTLYTLGGVSAGRALGRSRRPERQQPSRCWTVSLALDTG
ncbi:MAG: hypothetical protein ACRDQA_10710 [Nocardioidaceae bacterium]